MKKASYSLFVAGIISCLLLASGAYFWATSLMDSLYAYHSPLHDEPPPPGKPVGPPLTRRIVFVLLDALRLDTSLNADVMPFLNELRNQGARAVMHSRPPSYSDPAYSVLLTGAWPDLSDGPTFNLPYEETPTFTQDNLFSAAKREGLKTALSGYYWFEKLVPQDAVDESFYTPSEDQAADRQVVDAALPWLEHGMDNFVLIHIDQVDYAGHYEGGPRDTRWNAAARRADDLIREVVAELDLTQDTLLVASDHGQIDQGGHGGHEPVVLLEPFILVGAGVKSGDFGHVNMVDVAPTLAVLLGVNIPADSQGRALEEMLALTTIHTNALPWITYLQQKQLVEAYQSAIGWHVEALLPKQASAQKIVAAYQHALETARESRLHEERPPRGFVSLVIALIPAGILFWRRGKTVAWLWIGALIYNIFFHLRYVLLDHLTYSLSSVSSAEELILYVAITALASLGLAWIIVWWGLKAWRRNPIQAGELGLGLVLIVIYSLALPVLWSYYLNDVLTTWTLPDFPSVFWGFLSTVQILAVAVLGVLGTGAAVLFSWMVRNMSG